MSSLIVRTSKVSKNFGYFSALRDISINIEAGEAVAVLGPNGSGKSTLIKIIATHMRPSSGRIEVFGLSSVKKAKEVKRRIGYVAHGSFLYDELTVEENLRFYQSMFSAVPKTKEVNLDGLLGLVRLKKWTKTPVGNLSHGLRKRADIARAMVHEPKLLLLDEPFSGLDETSRNVLRDYLLHQHGEVTLMLTSHDAALARQVCRRSILLEKGTVVRDTEF